MALARQLTSSAPLKSKGVPLLRSALAEWPVSPRESVNLPPTFRVMSEEYRFDQSASGYDVASVVIRQEITVVNELGLHARPAAEFVRAAKAFRSQIWLVKKGERFSAASILDVLTANLCRGDTATIEAEGPDAEEAVKRLVELTREFGKRELGGKWGGPRREEEDF